MLTLIDNVPFNAFAWPGNWVWTQDAGSGFEVVQFCSWFADTEALPAKLHISADNRYKLYIDGIFWGLGPQRGSLDKYFFDTYDLSSQRFQQGHHVLSAVVWHDRDTLPEGQISSRPAFLAVCEDAGGKMKPTPDCWKYRRWHDNTTILVPEEAVCAGPGYDMIGVTADDLRPSKEVFDKEFTPVKVLGLSRNHKPGHPQFLLPWKLHPRTIPAMKAEQGSLGRCRRIIAECSSSQDVFLQDRISQLAQGGGQSVTISAQSRYRILIDKETLVTGYPTIGVSGGKGASIGITYQEALQSKDDDVSSKGNRDEVGQRIMIGVMDRFRLQGKGNVVLEPLWFRGWRYIELDIQTADQPLELKDLSYRSTGYPLELKAKFEVSDWFSRLIVPGIRTLECCASETFMDCPYYEQVQYIGDTRITALLSYVLCNDDKLACEAIDAFDRSRLINGLTQGGYPIRNVHVLPLFSLIYIVMLNDFLMWRGDIAFVQEKLTGVDAILKAFERCIKSNGLIGKLPGWAFVDWTQGAGWKKDGEPLAASQGDSFAVSFFYLYALQQAVNLYQYAGDKNQAELIERKAALLRETLRKEAFDVPRQVFIDDPSGLHLSQHTNILAILTDSYLGVVDGQLLMEKILSDSSMAKATVYFKFYLFEAMFHIGRADLIWPDLKLWHEMLDNGLTTFAETPEPSRSDCHAWSSHPLYHFIASLIGVRPAAPGCSVLSVRPLLNMEMQPPLPEKLSAAFDTPDGKCYIRLKSGKKGWDIYTEFPPGVQVADSDLLSSFSE